MKQLIRHYSVLATGLALLMALLLLFGGYQEYLDTQQDVQSFKSEALQVLDVAGYSNVRLQPMQFKTCGARLTGFDFNANDAVGLGAKGAVCKGFSSALEVHRRR